MNINEQEKTFNFVYKHDISCDVESRVLDLVSEIGTLSKMILKNTNYGREKFANTPEIEDEVGQAYLVFLELSNEIGVNLNDSLKRAIERNDLKLKDKEYVNETKGTKGTKEENAKAKEKTKLKLNLGFKKK